MYHVDYGKESVSYPDNKFKIDISISSEQLRFIFEWIVKIKRGISYTSNKENRFLFLENILHVSQCAFQTFIGTPFLFINQPS